MARIVQISVVCSRCPADDQVPAVAERNITIDGKELRLDLCKGCAAWYEEQIDPIRAIGESPTAAGEDDVIFDKKTCIFHRYTYSNAKTLREHLEKHHPDFWNSDAAVFWKVGEDKLEPCTYCDESFSRGTGMVAHKRIRHPEEFAREQAEKHGRSPAPAAHEPNPQGELVMT